MKIENLKIVNFRGITDVDLKSLGGMVIIAGQNGSGKSCIFDAIRLLKSVYGGYQANEWQQWMGEFQINLASNDFSSMFNDPKLSLSIACDFRIAEEERAYIKKNADDLLREKIWRTILPEAYGWGVSRTAMFAAQFRDREPEVAEKAKAEYALLMDELSKPVVSGSFNIAPGDRPTFSNSVALPIIFSSFRPKDIGVIDYHGAQRHYGRETVQGINLNLEANEQQRSQTALYNYANKYNNVKSEMAASYIKEILAERAGIPRESQSSLTNTLKELFETFFPEKKFLGPQPTQDGLLLFPVETSGGNIHDLDELSAGEKEILYGYLRIRNSAPKNSIILLDEPELHLNPRLIRGLPQFYRKHLGEDLNNQMWLVTHSDALLREVVGRDTYKVFHMLPCANVAKGESQLKLLSATADLDLALVDLVGDLASYRPGAKVLILEGGGDSDFDQKVVATLFPEIQEQANLISGTNKTRVRALHEILFSAGQKDSLPFKFFAITDRDSEASSMSGRPEQANTFSWDVYHIENYFLSPKYICRVLAALQISSLIDESSVWDALRGCARESIPQSIRHELSSYANQSLVRCINLGVDPKSDNLSGMLHDSIERSVEKIDELKLGLLSRQSLSDREASFRTDYLGSISDGSWVHKLPGRNILKKFVSEHANQVSYEVFRNLVLSQMKDDGFKPPGMKEIIDKILSA